MKMVKGINDNFLDRAGYPISRYTWEQLIADDSYARIGLTLTKYAEISTIWTGINRSPSPGRRPVIFETLVFAPGATKPLCKLQYANEQDAINGHNRLVGHWFSWHPPRALEPVAEPAKSWF